MVVSTQEKRILTSQDPTVRPVLSNDRRPPQGQAPLTLPTTDDLCPVPSSFVRRLNIRSWTSASLDSRDSGLDGGAPRPPTIIKHPNRLCQPDHLTRNHLFPPPLFEMQIFCSCILPSRSKFKSQTSASPESKPYVSVVIGVGVALDQRCYMYRRPCRLPADDRWSSSGH